MLITGASAGIGAELARQLAGRGHNVVLVARREQRLRELAEHLRLMHGVHADVEPCDLADAEARRALVARLLAGEREVAGVCNNAGFGTVGTLLEADLEREQRRRPRERRGRAPPHRRVPGADGASAARAPILNVASTAAFQPLPGFATYAASKAFVQSFSEAVHAELGGTGVSVTSLCPGFTHTEFGEAADAQEEERALPEFLFQEAPEVARCGIEAMIAGRRTAIPGLHNRASMLGGRLVPRSLLLPVVRRVNAARR